MRALDLGAREYVIKPSDLEAYMAVHRTAL